MLQITCYKAPGLLQLRLRRHPVSTSSSRSSPLLMHAAIPKLQTAAMSVIRTASHAGTWYSANATTLGAQIDRFIAEARTQGQTEDKKDDGITGSTGLQKGARVIVGPHAGYAYAGATLGKAYSAFDSSGIERVFILGPSHHVYFKGCVLTTNCDFYDTPFGKLQVDTEVVNELTELDSKLFKRMNITVDEDEHSFEMHMPFLHKVTESVGKHIKIVPIMISASDETFENKVALSLKPYFADKSNAFIVSTDFCHWGSRFSYTSYTPSGSLADLEELPKNGKSPSGALPIFKSIEHMDKAAMKVMSTGSYRSFKDYMYLTENTICGAKPLSVLMLLMQDHIEDRAKNALKFNGYAQSSQALTARDSSVSYGSAYAVI